MTGQKTAKQKTKNWYKEYDYILLFCKHTDAWSVDTNLLELGQCLLTDDVSKSFLFKK